MYTKYSSTVYMGSQHYSVLTITNMKLGGEMKLCDPTNNVMFKTMSFLGKQQHNLEQYIIKGTCMYVHVTDKEKHMWKTKLDTRINLYALTIVKVQ